MAITQVANFPTGVTGSNLTQVTCTVAAKGDLLILVLWNNSATISASSVSGAGATWAFLDKQTATGHADTAEMWWGVAQSTGSQTITVTWSSTPSSTEIDVQSLTAGTGSATQWNVVAHAPSAPGSATTTITWASLTSGGATLQAYFGEVDAWGTYTAGSTPGFTYGGLINSSSLQYTQNLSLSATTSYAPSSTQTSATYATTAAIFAAGVSGASSVPVPPDQLILAELGLQDFLAQPVYLPTESGSAVGVSVGTATATGAEESFLAPQPIPAEFILSQYGLDYELWLTTYSPVEAGTATSASSPLAVAGGQAQAVPPPQPVPPDQLILAQFGLEAFVQQPVYLPTEQGAAAAFSATVGTASASEESFHAPQPIPAEFILSQYGLDYELWLTTYSPTENGSALAFSSGVATATAREVGTAPVPIPPDQLVLAEYGLEAFLEAPPPATVAATVVNGSALAFSSGVAVAAGQAVEPPSPVPIPPDQLILTQYGLQQFVLQPIYLASASGTAALASSGMAVASAVQVPVGQSQPSSVVPPDQLILAELGLQDFLLQPPPVGAVPLVPITHEGVVAPSGPEGLVAPTGRGGATSPSAKGGLDSPQAIEGLVAPAAEEGELVGGSSRTFGSGTFGSGTFGG